MAGHGALNIPQQQADLETLLKTLKRQMNRLIEPNRSHAERLNKIVNELEELRGKAKQITAMRESVQLNLSIKEVEGFEKELSDHIKACKNFSKEPEKSDLLHQIDVSLRKQLVLLTSQEPNQPDKTGSGGIISKGTGSFLAVGKFMVNNLPGGSAVKDVAAKIYVRYGDVRQTNPPDERRAKELFGDLYGLVEGLAKYTGMCRDEIDSIENCLKSLNKEGHVRIMEEIEERNCFKLHINEVEDFRKVLWKGICDCRAFSESNKESFWIKRLYHVEKSLKQQLEILEGRKRKTETNTSR